MQPLLITLGKIADLLPAAELNELVAALETYGQRCVRPRVTLDQLPFETQPVPWTQHGRFLIDSSIRPGSYLQFAAGDYAIHDAASLLPLELMQLQPGQQVMDCCAAPGGKSAGILDQLDGRGLLVSNEVIASRIDTLQLTLARTGYWNYLLTHQPVERLVDAMAEQFDCVLVDAPCSGQSLVGRGKQSMSAFSEHQVAHSAARQQTILESAIELVRPGGRLVYSTCTFAYAENEGMVSWLRERLGDWQPVVLESLSAWQTPGYAGCYRLWPHRDHCAGGFAAALIRPDPRVPAARPLTPSSLSNSLDTNSLDTYSSGHNSFDTNSSNTNSSNPNTASMNAGRPNFDTAYRPTSIQPVRAKPSANSRRGSNRGWQAGVELELFDDWGRVLDSEMVYGQSQQVALFASEIPDAWRGLAHCGIQAAVKFGEHWQPAYPLAVLKRDAALTPFEAHQVTQLSDQEACVYLSGTSVHRPGPAGWQVVTWRDRPLGWAKQVGPQLKNHLPKPLRQPRLQCGKE